MSGRFDRYTLSCAEPEALQRLARFVKIDPSNCTCPQCTAELVELLVRKLDELDMLDQIDQLG